MRSDRETASMARLDRPCHTDLRLTVHRQTAIVADPPHHLLSPCSFTNPFTNANSAHRILREPSSETPSTLSINFLRRLIHSSSVPTASPVLCATSPAACDVPAMCSDASAWKPFLSVQQCLRRSAQPCASLVSFLRNLFVIDGAAASCATFLSDRHLQTASRNPQCTTLLVPTLLGCTLIAVTPRAVARVECIIC
jgi:hypothetical protein